MLKESKKVAGNKPIILVFIGNYLPGYKAGGILRNIVNTVDHLSDEFEFKIVTRDRDLGDEKPYDNIILDKWQKVGLTVVYYLSQPSSSYTEIKKLLLNTPHDILLLNSFFDPFTVKILLNRKLNPRGFKPIIVSPFGEFAWASLRQKYFKKFVFIHLARLIGLYNNITWRVSSEFEKLDLIKVIKVKNDPILITGDLPIKNAVVNPNNFVLNNSGVLNIVFLSRISREKNLDYALKVLKNLKVSVVFDIYGPTENELYWKECKKLIEQLPDNISVNYLGNATSDQVLNIFARYDLFLFPTGGEAYGNVIAECLAVGTPVLVSTETPWRNLEADGLGWDINLNDFDLYVKTIEEFYNLSTLERQKRRVLAKQNVQSRLFDPFIVESNISMFRMQLHN